MTVRQNQSYCLNVMTVTSGTFTLPVFDEAQSSVLDAAEACVERHGWDRVTMDDVCSAARISRATLYRIFPGGRDVIFEALRVRGLAHFFTVVRANVEGAGSLEDLLVRSISVAHAELAGDEHLATVLATAPGETLGDLTVNGVSRIISVATAFFAPLAAPFLPADDAEETIEVMCRMVISVFLAPSGRLDFSREDDVRRFVRRHLVPEGVRT